MPSVEILTKILEALISRYPGWMTSNDIAELTNIPVSTVKASLTVLAEKGIVEVKKLYTGPHRPRNIYRLNKDCACRDTPACIAPLMERLKQICS